MTDYKKLTDINSIGKALEDGVYNLNVSDETAYWRNRKTGNAYTCGTEHALRAIGRDYVPAGRRLSTVLTEAVLELNIEHPQKPERPERPFYIV